MAKKKDYKKIATDVLELVGGKDNVVFCEHCITRLRMNLKDKSLVNEEKLKDLANTNGFLWAGDQLQVIIGTAINGVYAEFCQLASLETVAAIDENLDSVKKKKTLKERLQDVLAAIVECIVPVLNILVAMGMFAAVISIIGPTGLKLVTEESGIYKLFNITQTAIMYVMPAAIACTAAKKFKVNPAVAVVLVAIQLHPDWVSGVTDGSLGLFGIAPIAMTINGQLIPAILNIWLLSKLDRFLTNLIPDNLKFVFVTTLEFMIMLPISMYVFTPLGTMLGLVVAMPIQMLEAVFPPLVSFIAGGLYNFFIAIGMHSGLSGAFVMDLFTEGVNYSLLPTVFSQCWIIAACNLGIALKTKDIKLKANAKECIVSAIVGGVMEPSIYSIYLKNFKLMIAASLGMAVTGFVHRILGVGVYALSSSGFIGFTAFLAGGMDNFLMSIPGILVGSAVAFVLAIVFTQKEA